MAGVIDRTGRTLGYDTSSRRNSIEILFEWTGDDSDGTVPALLVDDLVGWWITRIVVVPGTIAPTPGYSITLMDTDGVDLAYNSLLSLSSTELLAVSLNSQIGFDGVTLTIEDQSVLSAEGTIRIFLKK